ncbi:cag pathogenicity island protein [Campylobacter sp. MIT 12-8780]|uniref:cag pathogenicity island Cag12 family protein n=1 Tax=unclassified Campylobacter TaxID=2593542 RepID=UPI0010F5942E|nr:MULTISPECIES: cag pathogenicity island Cag12 family protein [unclassified Campylobacter]NDJ28062.1 cag pathogenicity island protein [Campylobacter sp. MIT 19-121]TKX28286.1 cag pathogenicity island protein [Campylobacter sp. MIT 12-5580]TQR39972.1 cag pathogenicity island protein [Campylobacter sp. MIT 12-8780]
MFHKHYLTFAVAISLFIAGCAAKKPKELDDNSAQSINNALLERQYNFVPKDSFLSSFNWTYHINATKENGELLRNEQMVKVFLLAHNATKIIIVGKKDLIKEYEKYLRKNQVKALIELQDVDPIERDINTVNLLFFNQTQGDK